MSFLLNHNARKAKQLGGTAPARAPLRSAAAPTMHRPVSTAAPTTMHRPIVTAGRGQVQIQRPAIVQQTPQQQQQHRVQGVISMEEVIADLRILEEQQVESERKLQHTRKTKQRHLEQQKSLESKLDQILYQNGQLRAELEHETDTLSKDQRALIQARTVVGKAGVDLREFDRKLKKALEMKSLILAHRRTQDRLLADARRVVDDKKLVQQQSRAAHDNVVKKVEAAKQFEESLRQGIRNEAVVHQQNAAQLAEIRSRCAALEKKHDDADNLQVSLRSQDDVTAARSTKEDERFATVLAGHEAKDAAEKVKIREANESKERLRTEAVVKREKLHQVWLEIVGIQKDEGHEQGLLPSESNAPPVLDLNRIQSRLQTEIDAVREEVAAKLQVSTSVDSHRRDLAALDTEKTACTAALESLKTSNATGEKNEAERASTIDKLKVEHETIDRCSSLLQDRRLKMDVGRTALKEELELTNREIAAATSQRNTLTREIKHLDSNIADKKRLHEQFKADAEAKLGAKQSELNDEVSRNDNIREELERRIQESAQASNPTRDEQYRKAENTLAEKFEKHPEIADVNFHYREDLSDQEQARIDLADLLDSIRRRTKLAEAQYIQLTKTKNTDRDVGLGAPKHGKEAGFRRSKVESKTKIADFEESAAKPRSLLDSFMSVEDEGSFRGSHGGASQLSEPANSRVPKDKYSKGVHLKQREAVQEKRVRWVGTSQNSVEPIEKPRGSDARRQAFSSNGHKKTTGNSGDPSGRASSSQNSKSSVPSKSKGAVLGKRSSFTTDETSQSDCSQESSTRPRDSVPKISSFAGSKTLSKSSLPAKVANKSTSSRSSRVSDIRPSDKVTKAASSRSTKEATTLKSSRPTDTNRAKPSSRSVSSVAADSLASIGAAKPSIRSTSVAPVKPSSSRTTSLGGKVRMNDGTSSRASFSSVVGVTTTSNRPSKVKVPTEPSHRSTSASIASSRPGSSSRRDEPVKRSTHSLDKGVSRSSTQNPAKKMSRPVATKNGGSVKSKGSVSNAPKSSAFHESKRHGTKRASSEQASGISSRERDTKKRRRTPVSSGVVCPDRSGFDDDFAFDFSGAN